MRVAIPAASTTAATARSSPGPRLPAPYATVSAPLHVAALFVHRLRCALGADLPCSLGGSILAPVPPAPRQTLPRFGRVSKGLPERPTGHRLSNADRAGSPRGGDTVSPGAVWAATCERTTAHVPQAAQGTPRVSRVRAGRVSNPSGHRHPAGDVHPRQRADGHGQEPDCRLPGGRHAPPGAAG